MDTDVVSQVFSFAAIVVSILTAIYSERSSRASIRADNCGKIFDDYLINKIPKARTNLRFGADGKLYNGNELCDALTDMMMSSLFYKYSDNSFYKPLGEKCQILEDTIVEAGNYARDSEHDQKKTLDDIQDQLEDIYKMIEDKRIGRGKIVNRCMNFLL